MSGPITLTPEQMRQDFLAVNPTQHYVSIIIGKEEEMSAAVTVYTHESELKFGKYKGTGLTVEDIITKDAKYLIWAHENVAWFALEEEIYDGACILAGTKPDPKLLKKATQTKPEQPSKQHSNADMFDNDDDDDGVPF